MSGFDVEADGAEIAAAGESLVAGSSALIEAVAVLARETVFLKRPDGEHARFSVLTVAGVEWILGFSSLSRLVRASGPCRWMALTGDDLMDNMPPGVNLGVDVQDRHGFSVPAELIAARSLTRSGAVRSGHAHSGGVRR